MCMIFFKNFSFIYKTAKILARNLKFLVPNPINYVYVYNQIINTKNDVTELMEGLTREEKFVLAFTAVSLHDNPKLPEGTPLMVANNLFYFTILTNSDVRDEKECPECPDSSGEVNCPECGVNGGMNLCDWCLGSGEVNCPNCDGDGEDSEGEPCDTCQGGGRVECDHCENGLVICDSCDGSGLETCDNCNGTGKVLSENHIEVDIENFISDDMELYERLKNDEDNKTAYNDVFLGRLKFHPRVLNVGGIFMEIEESDVSNLQDYEGNTYVFGVKKIKSLSDINGVTKFHKISHKVIVNYFV